MRDRVDASVAGPAVVGAMPAITRTVALRGPTATVELPDPPADAAYEVRATTHSDTGMTSETMRAAMPAPGGAGPP